MGARAACCAGSARLPGAFFESAPDPAPPPSRRGAGRRRLRLGAAGVRGGAARLSDGDPGAEQRARLHQPGARPVRRAACSSRSTRRRARFARRKVRYVGNPVRRTFLERAARRARPDATARRVDRDPGRQPGLARGQRARLRDGARARRARAAAADRPPDRPRRARRACRSTTRRSATRGRVEVRAFIDDMPAVLADAALVVARAGALTLAELAIMRRPAILIPLPTAADDHQTMQRARLRARGRRACVLPQADGSATRLGDLVDEILQDPARHAAMAAAMGDAGPRPSATQRHRRRAAPPSRAAGSRANRLGFESEASSQSSALASTRTPSRTQSRGAGGLEPASRSRLQPQFPCSGSATSPSTSSASAASACPASPRCC